MEPNCVRQSGLDRLGSNISNSFTHPITNWQERLVTVVVLGVASSVLGALASAVGEVAILLLIPSIFLGILSLLLTVPLALAYIDEYNCQEQASCVREVVTMTLKAVDATLQVACLTASSALLITATATTVAMAISLMLKTMGPLA